MTYEPIRSELSAESEKLRAIEELTNLGLLLPLADMDVYHGRSTIADSDAWNGVNPDIKNTKDDIGNNVHYRPALYAGDKDLAEEHANERAQDHAEFMVERDLREQAKAGDPVAWRKQELAQRQELFRTHPEKYELRYLKPPEEEVTNHDDWEAFELRRVARHKMDNADLYPEVDESWDRQFKLLRTEVHKIVSSDEEARIIDLNFAWSELNEEDLDRFHCALENLLPPVIDETKADPAKVDSMKELIDGWHVLASKTGFIENEADAIESAKATGLSEEEAKALVGSYNARQQALVSPARLTGKYMGKREDIVITSIKNDGELFVLLNLGYVPRMFEALHIVGAQNTVRSSTLGREITMVSFLDLNKINTVDKVAEARTKAAQSLGALAHKE